MFQLVTAPTPSFHGTTAVLWKNLHATLLAILIVIFGCSSASAELLRNDGWETDQSAAFQGGFVAGEIGAVRLVPTEACPCDLQTIELLFGGAPGQQNVTLRIWDDAAEQDVPGAELFSGDFVLTGADDAINLIDLSSENIVINGPVRVGIEFQHSGFPSIARDTDGTINVSRNFIYTSGTWFRSSLFGITGDWIVRATTTTSGDGFSVGGVLTGFAGNVVLQNNGGDDLLVSSNGTFAFPTLLPDGMPYNVTVLSEPPESNCTILNGSGTIMGAHVNDVLIDCGSSILRNDGWESGLEAAFQGGFIAGEIGAVRLVPTDACPCDISRVELLFGGAPGLSTVTLHIWDDANENVNPGAELFSGDFQLTGADDAMNVIDLSAENLSVDGPFRVGIEFSSAGFPSIARDSDGTINTERNFIYTSGTWFRSSLFGLTGDWIIRAAASGVTTSVPESAPDGRIHISPSPYVGGDLTISFALAPQGPETSAQFSIFDASGRLVRMLKQDNTDSGIETATWDGRNEAGTDVRSGVYFVRRLSSGYAWSQKITVIR